MRTQSQIVNSKTERTVRSASIRSSGHERGSRALLLFALFATCIVAVRSAVADDFWVGYWAHPKPILYGAEEEAFYRNLKEVMFERNEYNRSVNPSALDDNARCGFREFWHAGKISSRLR